MRALVFSFVLLLIAACEPASRQDSYVLAGGLQPTQITLKAVGSGPGTVQFHLLDDALASIPMRSSEKLPLSGDGVYAATHVFAGLTPGKQYHYLGEVNSSLGKSEEFRGAFTTPEEGPFSYSLAFGSCAKTGSSGPAFVAIQKENPLFFMHIGDLHYEDIDSDCSERFFMAYFRAFTARTQQTLYHAVPLAYMWDDHDYGPNNSAGDAPCRNEALRQYQQLVPHYPLAFESEGKPISQSFSIGRVRYLLTDLRSQKVQPAYADCERVKIGSVFGTEEHLRWFLFQLLEAKIQGQVVAWVSGIPWINAPGGPRYKCTETDNWGGYPEERTRIADFIRDNGIPLFILSGDAHMLAIDDGTHSDYATGGGAPLPVFHAAPLDRPGSIKGGPYSHGVQDQTGQYGLMRVEDTGGDELCIQWIGKSKDGSVARNKEGQPLEYRFCLKL
jgi:phosphodiesterase/alkaline phosphatase D-like protein